jgi:hypothetical protein
VKRLPVDWRTFKSLVIAFLKDTNEINTSYRKERERNIRPPGESECLQLLFKTESLVFILPSLKKGNYCSLHLH